MEEGDKISVVVWLGKIKKFSQGINNKLKYNAQAKAESVSLSLVEVIMNESNLTHCVS